MLAVAGGGFQARGLEEKVRAAGELGARLLPQVVLGVVGAVVVGVHVDDQEHEDKVEDVLEEKVLARIELEAKLLLEVLFCGW